MSRKDGSLRFFNDLTAYSMRKGFATYALKSKITSCVVHPDYDGTPHCGYDIALCLLGEELGSKNHTIENYSD